MTVVEKQIASYNNRDLSSFLECYDDKIEVYMLQSGAKITDGIAQLEKIMGEAFKSNDKSKTTILTSINQGDLIVNQEKIEGHEEGKVIYTISIYEVKNEKISKLWFGGRTIKEL